MIKYATATRTKINVTRISAVFIQLYLLLVGSILNTNWVVLCSKPVKMQVLIQCTCDIKWFLNVFFLFFQQIEDNRFEGMSNYVLLKVSHVCVAWSNRSFEYLLRISFLRNHRKQLWKITWSKQRDSKFIITSVGWWYSTEDIRFTAKDATFPSHIPCILAPRWNFLILKRV